MTDQTTADAAGARAPERIVAPMHILGWRGLIPILPADARPAPGAPAAKIMAARGKAPGMYDPASGGWRLLPQWADAAPPTGWERWPGANVGVVLGRASGLLAIDVDVTDPLIARELEEHLRARLPGAPLRIGQAPKHAFLLRLDPTDVAAGTIPRKLKTGVYEHPDGRDVGQLELLAEGQQIVVAGRHPSGVDYRWPHDGGTADRVDVRALPTLSAAAARELVERARDGFERRGFRRRTLTRAGATGPGGGPVPVAMEDHLAVIDVRDPAQRRAWLDEWCVAGGRHHATVALTAKAVSWGLDRETILGELAGYRDGAGMEDAAKAWDGAVGKGFGDRPATPPPPEAPLAETPVWAGRAAVRLAPDAAEAIAGLEPVALPSPESWPAPDDPEPEGPAHLLGDLFPRRTVGTLYGADGIGKSSLTLALAVHMGLGAPFLGGRRPAAPRRSLMIYTEDPPAALRSRMWRMVQAFGRSAMDARDRLADMVHAVSVDELPSAVFGARDVRNGVVAATPFAAAVEERIVAAKAAGRPYDMVALDSLSDIHAVNENDRSEVTQLMRLLASLAARHDLFVLIVGHPPKDQLKSDGSEDVGRDFSGSGAWSGKSRTRMTLFGPTKSEPKDVRRLIVRKSSYSGAAETAPVLLMMDRGVPLDRTPTDVEAAANEARIEIEARRAVVAFVRDRVRQGRLLAVSIPAKPKVWREMLDAAAAGALSTPLPPLGERHLRGVLERMLQEGVLEERKAREGVAAEAGFIDYRGRPTKGVFARDGLTDAEIDGPMAARTPPPAPDDGTAGW